MTKLKILGAAALVAAMIATPMLEQADEYYRHRHHHHHHRHIAWFSYIHIAGRAPVRALASYDGPTSVRASRAPPPIAARTVAGIRAF